MVSKIAPTPKPPKARRGRNVMLGITLMGQLPVLEHARNGHAGRLWRLWLSYDDNYENGLFFELYDDGSVRRFVVSGGKTGKSVLVKDAD